MTDCKTLIARGNWAEDLALERCTFPIGPRNTWSNVAYLLAGAALVIWRPTGPHLVLALALTFLAAGSFAYHGWKTSLPVKLDHAGMYAVFGALAVYALLPAHPLIWIGMVVGALSAALVLTRQSFRLPGSMDVHMGIFLALVFLRALFGGHFGLGVLSLIVFAIAYLFWTVDRQATATYTPPTGVWGHSCWHLATAVAVALAAAGVSP